MNPADPYTPPASPAPEDRTDPAFKAILGFSWETNVLLFVIPGLFGVWLLCLWLTSSARFVDFPPLSFTMIFLPLVRGVRNFQESQKLRSHPLVTGGQALYGGVANCGAVAGYLFITRSAFHFFQNSGGWEAGEMTSVSFAEIESLSLRPRLVFPPIYLDLSHHSGSVTTFTVTRGKVWFRAINQLRHEISAAVPPP